YFDTVLHFFFSSRRRHTRSKRDWSSDVCSSDLGRPEKFMMIHFSNEIWKNNSAEIMKHAHTSPQTFHTVEQFAEHIGMLPLPLYKEHPGYILNSLLTPLFGAAQRLLIDGIADVETIDKTWMATTGAEQGPFGSLDAIG